MTIPYLFLSIFEAVQSSWFQYSAVIWSNTLVRSLNKAAR
jgi:hypothetical protein